MRSHDKQFCAKPAAGCFQPQDHWLCRLHRHPQPLCQLHEHVWLANAFGKLDVSQKTAGAYIHVYQQPGEPKAALTWVAITRAKPAKNPGFASRRPSGDSSTKLPATDSLSSCSRLVTCCARDLPKLDSSSMKLLPRSEHCTCEHQTQTPALNKTQRAVSLDTVLDGLLSRFQRNQQD